MKRLLSLFLVLSMLSAEFLPAAAMAAEASDQTGETVSAETEAPMTEETEVPTTQGTVPPVSVETIPQTTAGTIPAVTEESVPETTAETIPVVTEETVPETTEETVPETTEETIPETTEETIPETTEEILEDPSGLSPEEIQAIFARNDGTWLFPLDRSFYESISSWCGSRNSDLCLVCGMVHTAADMALTANGNFGMEFEIPAGTPFYAPAPGYVFYGTCVQFGDLLILEHETNTEYSYYSVFASLNSRDVPDQSIADAGQLLGTSRDTLSFSVFRDYAGLGEDIAADPYTSLLQAQQRGWVGSGRERGMICNNPSPYSEDYRPIMEDHPGTVTYTFLKDEVTIQPPQVTDPEPEYGNTPQAGTGTDANAQNADPVFNGLTYQVESDGTIKITGSTAPITGALNIPASIDGKKVTMIGHSAFLGQTGITSVHFPDTIVTLQDRAFERCTGITNIDYPVNWKSSSFEKGPFEYCTGLTSVTIPEGVTDIPSRAFRRCTSLNQVTLPTTLRTIHNFAFADCSFTSLKLPDTITEIRPDAFAGCLSLSSVNFPKSWTKLDGAPFTNCPKLTEITIPEGITVIPEHAFLRCRSFKKINLPTTLAYIGNSAFAECSGLSTIDLPEGVTELGWNAFRGCTGFTSVKLPEGLTKLGRDVFAGCTNLSSVNYPMALKTCEIGGSFGGCTKLTEITIPEGITSVVENLFQNCENLSIVHFPSTLTHIGSRAFSNCRGITELNLPSGLKSMGWSSFSGCSGLQEVRLPEGFTTLGRDTFADCKNLKFFGYPTTLTSAETHGAFANCPSLKEITIPEGVTFIPEGLFANTGWLETVRFPSTLESVGSFSFKNCPRLTALNLPSKVREIGWYSFAQCRNLKELRIPDSVETLGEGVFAECTGLQQICFSKNIKRNERYILNGCSNLQNVIFPEGTRRVPYAIAAGSGVQRLYIPDTVTEISDMAFDRCSRLTDIYYSGNVFSWNMVVIRKGNDPVHNATVHYNWDLSDLAEPPQMDNFSVVVKELSHVSGAKEEIFKLSAGASVQGTERKTQAPFSGTTNGYGEVTVAYPTDSGMIFSKNGFVTRKLSLERLEIDNTVYLQKSTDKAPVINALWLFNRDILHNEYISYLPGDAVYEFETEIFWGISPMKKLSLFQDGVEIPLNDGKNSLQLSKRMDITKPIRLVAVNQNDQVTERSFTLKSSQASSLDGFSFKLSDSLELELPDWLPPFLSNQKIEVGLKSLVPVEVSIDNGKVLFAFGVQHNTSPDNNKDKNGQTDKDRDIGIFASTIKEIRESIDSVTKTEDIRKMQEKVRNSMDTLDVSVDKGICFTGFCEGYLDENNHFHKTDSYGVITMDISKSYNYPTIFMGYPIFFEVSLEDEFSVQADLFINEKIREFTPSFKAVNTAALSGGVGVGIADIASSSGGLKGKCINTLELNKGSVNYFQMKGILEWYLKFQILFFTYTMGDKLLESTWLEYPDPGNTVRASSPAMMGDASCFVKEDLSYQARGSSFMGVAMEDPAVFAIQKESNNVPFVSNAYSGAAPQTVTFADGKRLAVWVGSMDGSSDPDSMNLWYSRYDGSWSQPRQVDPDGTMDGALALKAVGSKAYLVYQDAVSKVGGISSLPGIAPYIGISAAVYDSAADSFTCQSISSGSLCTLPNLCFSGNTVHAVWQQNGGNDWFGTHGGNAICTSSFNGSTWSAPQQRISCPYPILNLTAYGNCDIAYTADTDGDLNTSEDMEIFRNGNRVTDNTIRDSGACFAGGALYWNADGRLLREGQLCMEEDAFITSDRFQIVDQNGLRVLVYAEEDGLASVLYAAFASGTGWGRPMEIFRGGTSIPHFDATADSRGRLSILIQSQSVVGDFGSADPYGRTDLLWFNAPALSCNLELQSVYADTSSYIAGKEMPVYVTVKNTSQLAVKQVNIQLKEADGTIASETSAVLDLQSGETREIPIHYHVKQALQGRVLTVSIAAKGMEETITSDNEKNLPLSFQDLAVKNVAWGRTDSGQTVIHADILNLGSDLQENIRVELREASPIGKVLVRQTVPSIEPQKLHHISFTCKPRFNMAYYVRVIPGDMDLNSGNNSDYTYYQTDFKIAAANMTLGSTLTMHFYFNQADLKPSEQYYAQITKLNPDGTDNMSIKIPQKDFRKFGGNLYQISFPHLAAKEMANDLRVQIFYADGTPASEPRIDGIRAYSMRIFKSQPKMVRTMLLDMLNYGAEAQRFFKYNQEDPANNQFSARDQWDATGNIRISDHRVKGKNYAGSTLKLESRLMMDLYFTNVTADQYAVLSYVDHTGRSHEKKVSYSQMTPNGPYRIITVNDMVIADCRQLITCKLYNGQGQEVGSVVDSPESYCARMNSKDKIYGSIMKFSQSAHYYLHNR